MAVSPIDQKLLLPLLLILLHIQSIHCQQAYVDNHQLDCNNNYTATNGFLCNGPRSSCTAYLTYRALAPYNTPLNISFLLGANSTSVQSTQNAALSSSTVSTLPVNDFVLVPVHCLCTKGKVSYYQHNVTYTLRSGETYFSVANNTFQGLATCQALRAENRYGDRDLNAGIDIMVPIMCACPSRNQTGDGVRVLVSYLVTWGDSVASIAEMFGVDEASVLEANELQANSVIYPFTPILVPVKNTSVKISVPTPPPPPPPPPPPGKQTGAGGSKKWVFVGIGIAGCVVVMSVVLCAVWFCRGAKDKLPPTPSAKAFADGNKESDEYAALSGSKDRTPTTDSWSLSTDGLRSVIESMTVYKYEELKTATDSFSDDRRIKGSVFRGSFKGDDAAVKIMKGDVSNEISILKRINHTNIIRLSGFCVHEGYTYLVFEYAEKGSLRDWLTDRKKDRDGFNVLGWRQRVQISRDVADALNYLHHYANPPYIHKNLTSSNVLLDANFRGKITNFALARTVENEEGLQFTAHVVGTQGYLAPEYVENGVMTPQLDVYAFGIVILELLSGRVAAMTAHDGDEAVSASSINQVIEGANVREKLQRFMDDALGQEYPLDLAHSMAQLAQRCVSHDLNARPPMTEILMALSKIHSSSLDWDPSDHSSSLSVQVQW